MTKKSSGSVSSTDSVSTGKPVENKDQIKNSSDGSASKPSNSSGTTGGNTGGNSGSSSSNPSAPVHSHNWVAVTKTVHHDAVTKVVHHDAVTKVVHHDAVTKTVTVTDKEAWDEPVYESRYICNRCGFSTKDGGEITDHIIDVCDSGYHVGKVQVNTIHHPAQTHTETKVVTPAYDETVVVKAAWDETVVVKAAYDETVVTGYKCSCGATK